MNTELGELLNRAVPDPPRLLDADLVLRLARRRGRRRVAMGLAALAVVAVAGPVAAVHLQPAPEDVADVPLRLSALDRRQPIGEAAARVLVGETLVHPGQASLAGEGGRWRVLLAETVDRKVCVVVESRGDGAGGCQPWSDLLTTGVILATILSGNDADPWLIVVAVPDGYTRAAIGATTASVSNNVGLLEGRFTKDDELVIWGRGLPTVAFPLDGTIPPR